MRTQTFYTADYLIKSATKAHNEMSANQTLAVTWMNAVLHGYVGYTSRIVRTTAKMHVYM